MPRPWIPPDLGHLLERYRSGESEQSLSKSYGVSRGVIRRILTENGVQPRSGSEAQTIRMERLSAEERIALAAAAHAAVRGSKQTIEHREAAARTNGNRLNNVSITEMTIANWLRDHGRDVSQQTPVGPYNCDITFSRVAVEVYGGNWHFSGRHQARAQERIRHFFDRGWHFVIVLVGPDFPLLPTITDYLITFAEEARRNPSSVRQYRMVGGDGELLASADSDADQVPHEYPFRRTRDAKGRYRRASWETGRM